MMGENAFHLQGGYVQLFPLETRLYWPIWLYQDETIFFIGVHKPYFQGVVFNSQAAHALPCCLDPLLPACGLTLWTAQGKQISNGEQFQAYPGLTWCQWLISPVG